MESNYAAAATTANASNDVIEIRITDSYRLVLKIGGAECFVYEKNKRKVSSSI